MLDYKAKTIDEFINHYPIEVQKILVKIRQTIKNAAPLAEETINYGIPTFKLNGNLVHFAAYAKHIGFYPGSKAIEIFAEELTEYKTSKGTIQFDLKNPIPYDLIKKITKYRVEVSLAKNK
jgi:uncharacterized protein YdhG (YjbR/CyaY superfamily)